MPHALLPYFAYGSNMDAAQMRYRCPGARAIGTAHLPDYRFVINERGFASVIVAPAHHVYGVLWHINAAHERALDDYEAVDEGWYDKTIVTVHVGRTQTLSAMIYIACSQVEGRPAREYMQHIVTAAEDFQLPAAYVDELRSWLRPR